jgi:hypothetical protein
MRPEKGRVMRMRKKEESKKNKRNKPNRREAPGHCPIDLRRERNKEQSRTK